MLTHSFLLLITYFINSRTGREGGRMWQLSMRDRNKNWTELGTFGGIGLAAHRVLELEHRDRPIEALFFRVYTDPMMEKIRRGDFVPARIPGRKRFLRPHAAYAVNP
jgi:hypothetical protein